jgi:hypothetical protein
MTMTRNSGAAALIPPVPVDFQPMSAVIALTGEHQHQRGIIKGVSTQHTARGST